MKRRTELEYPEWYDKCKYLEHEDLRITDYHNHQDESVWSTWHMLFNLE